MADYLDKLWKKELERVYLKTEEQDKRFRESDKIARILNLSRPKEGSDVVIIFINKIIKKIKQNVASNAIVKHKLDELLKRIVNSDFNNISEDLELFLGLSSELLMDLKTDVKKNGTKYDEDIDIKQKKNDLIYQDLLEKISGGKSQTGCLNLIQLTMMMNFDTEYQIVQKLGHGASGMVYKVYSQAEDKYKAVKVICAPNYNNLEAKILASLSHENIVTIHSATRKILPPKYLPCDKKLLELISDEVILEMEYVDGETLEQKLKTSKKGFSREKAVKYSGQLLDAITYLISKDIRHRDLNLKNIKITEADSIKIIDFGISENKTEISKIKDNRKYGDISDIFSWGLITYEMLTGKHFIYEREPYMGIYTFSEIIAKMKEKIRTDDGKLTEEYRQKLYKNIDKEIAENIELALECISDREKELQVISNLNKSFMPKVINDATQKKKAMEQIIGHDITDEQGIELLNLATDGCRYN